VAASLAAGNACRALTLARRLQARTIAAINAGRVPSGLQEDVSGSVNALVARVTCVPPPAPSTEKKHGREKHKGHHGHNKHGKGDD